MAKLTDDEETEIQHIQALIETRFKPMTRAWADGTPSNVLDMQLREANEWAKPMYAAIERIRKTARER